MHDFWFWAFLLVSLCFASYAALDVWQRRRHHDHLNPGHPRSPRGRR